MGVVLVDDNGNPLHAVFEVYPCNREAQALFQRCFSQWFRNADGAPVGLNYPGVESVVRMSGAVMTPELFDELQWIEQGVLGASCIAPELTQFEIIKIELADP